MGTPENPSKRGAPGSRGGDRKRMSLYLLLDLPLEGAAGGGRKRDENSSAPGLSPPPGTLPPPFSPLGSRPGNPVSLLFQATHRQPVAATLAGRSEPQSCPSSPALCAAGVSLIAHGPGVAFSSLSGHSPQGRGGVITPSLPAGKVRRSKIKRLARDPAAGLPTAGTNPPEPPKAPWHGAAAPMAPCCPTDSHPQ